MIPRGPEWSGPRHKTAERFGTVLVAVVLVGLAVAVIAGVVGLAIWMIRFAFGATR